MSTEQNPNYSISSKTGWTRENGINIGWWVGYVETKGGVYFLQHDCCRTENKIVLILENTEKK